MQHRVQDSCLTTHVCVVCVGLTRADERHPSASASVGIKQRLAPEEPPARRHQLSAVHVGAEGCPGSTASDSTAVPQQLTRAAAAVAVEAGGGAVGRLQVCYFAGEVRVHGQAREARRQDQAQARWGAVRHEALR